MIDPSLPHLHALHVRACNELRATGCASPLSAARTPGETLTAAQDAAKELVTCLHVAGRARCFRQVADLIEPAQKALGELIKGCEEDLTASLREAG